MRTIALRLLAAVLALFLASAIVAGIHIDGIYTAVIVALILGVLNVVVRPILVILTLPITILTLGLFLFVLNAALFWFVGSFVEGFTVSNFLAALYGSIIVSLTSWTVDRLTN